MSSAWRQRTPLRCLGCPGCDEQTEKSLCPSRNLRPSRTQKKEKCDPMTHQTPPSVTNPRRNKSGISLPTPAIRPARAHSQKTIKTSGERHTARNKPTKTKPGTNDSNQPNPHPPKFHAATASSYPSPTRRQRKGEPRRPPLPAPHYPHIPWSIDAPSQTQTKKPGPGRTAQTAQPMTQHHFHPSDRKGKAVHQAPPATCAQQIACARFLFSTVPRNKRSLCDGSKRGGTRQLQHPQTRGGKDQPRSHPQCTKEPPFLLFKQTNHSPTNTPKPAPCSPSCNPTRRRLKPTYTHCRCSAAKR